MTEERQPDEVLRIIARPELDQYHDYAVHELWLGSFKITSGGKAHCAACAVELNRELSKHSEQQLAEARAQGDDELFCDECEQPLQREACYHVRNCTPCRIRERAEAASEAAGLISRMRNLAVLGEEAPHQNPENVFRRIREIADELPTERAAEAQKDGKP